TPAEQIKFLRSLQHLLSDGDFTATYKYALLMALAELSVELGDDSGAPLDVPLRKSPRNSPCTTGRSRHRSLR
ncbi:MAG TPA: hypothetical protein VF774_14240, partial [Pseudoduganella sp.]